MRMTMHDGQTHSLIAIIVRSKDVCVPSLCRVESVVDVDASL